MDRGRVRGPGCAGFGALTLATLFAGAAGPLHDPAMRQAPGLQGEMEITTDTSSYCRTLSDLIGASGKLPKEARELKNQGDGLCNSGEVRGGIDRLRRALLVVQASHR